MMPGDLQKVMTDKMSEATQSTEMEKLRAENEELSKEVLRLRGEVINLASKLQPTEGSHG